MALLMERCTPYLLSLKGRATTRKLATAPEREEPGKSLSYRVKMEISFKYEGGD
jgi:hypothetical protein